MKLHELESGNVVRLRNNEVGICIGESFITEECTRFFDEYDEYMFHEHYVHEDIVAVYDRPACLAFLEGGPLRLLWRRGDV